VAAPGVEAQTTLPPPSLLLGRQRWRHRCMRDAFGHWPVQGQCHEMRRR